VQGTEGLDQAPRAFIGRLRGENLGKMREGWSRSDEVMESRHRSSPHL